MANKTVVKLAKFDGGSLRRSLGFAVMAAAKRFEADTRERIYKSKPRGRRYSKGKGRGFHRASAPGQRPAIDTATLIRSIRTRRLNELSAVVDFASNRSPDGVAVRYYTSILQYRRNRIIMTKRDAKLAEPIVKEEIIKAVRRLT